MCIGGEENGRPQTRLLRSLSAAIGSSCLRFTGIRPIV